MALSWFRTRSPERDRNTDEMRLARVRQAIEHARDEAQRERLGLQSRADRYDAKASSLLDHSAAFERRSAQDESEISLAEEHALRARARVQRTGEQVEFFEELLGRLEAFQRASQDHAAKQDVEQLAMEPANAARRER